MHDPCTVAFDIKWPFGGRVWNGHRFRPVIATIWHVDPEKNVRHGNRSDDSCGWHTPPTTPEQRDRFHKIGEEEYRDIFGKRRAVQDGESYASVCFEPTCYDAVYWAWRRIKREHGKGQWKYGEQCLSAAELDRIYHMASCPIDNYRVTVAGIDSPEKCGDFFVSILKSYLRFNRPWWKHPRWHFWHWRIQLRPWQSLRRWLFTRCAHCGKRFPYGGSPISHGWNRDEGHGWFQSERGVYHEQCSAEVMRATIKPEVTMHTKDKLASELRKIGLLNMSIEAANGYYDDFLSPLATPCIQLAADLAAVGSKEAMALRARHLDGEFDATKEESDAWARSPEGQAVAKELSPAMREAMDLKLNN